MSLAKDFLYLEVLAGDPEAVRKLLARVVEQAECHVIPTNNAMGYVTFFHGGMPVMAHRLAYRISKGPIPDGYEVHHKCEVKNCVNPDHLEALTPVEHAAQHPNCEKRLNPKRTMFRRTPGKALLAGGHGRKGYKKKDVAA